MHACTNLKISEPTQQKLDKYASDELSRIGARGEPITVKTVLFNDDAWIAKRVEPREREGSGRGRRE